MNNVKIIFHIDLNAFYASCAMIKEPFLRDKIFVIGGKLGSTSGVISTASYKARELGIRSAMSIQEALRIYPKLLIVPTDFALYQKHSTIFFRFLKTYTNKLLVGSIDEAYLDVTELAKDKHPLKLAKEIQDRLLSEHQLPVSIGIGPTLFLAKMASDMKKPLGITVLRKRDVEKVLYPMPIGKVYGIGTKTASLLEEINIHTVADFVSKDNKDKILEIMTINSYDSFIDRIYGNSSDYVDPNLYAVPKSISNEETLSSNVSEVEILQEHLTELIKTTVDRLHNEEMVARTIFIKLRYSNFRTITRSKTIDIPTDDIFVISEIAEQLFLTNFENRPVRLIGIGLSQLIFKKDLKDEINLFNYNKLTERDLKITSTIKEINELIKDEVITLGVKKTHE